LKKLLLAAALVAATCLSARAQTVVDDPLHLCYASGCTSFNSVTIGSSSNPLSGWGFSSSPSGQTGQLTVDLLVPSNETFVMPTLTGTDVIGGKTTTLTIGAFTQVATLGPNQDLTQVLNNGAAPPNPYSAYSAATHALDPGFDPNLTTYVVLQAVVSNPNFNTLGQGSALNNSFTLSSMPAGTIITGFLATGGKLFSTAQSSALVLNTPLPGALVLMAGGLGLLGIAGRRRKTSRLVA
jgi:hypothetical protein